MLQALVIEPILVTWGEPLGQQGCFERLLTRQITLKDQLKSTSFTKACVLVLVLHGWPEASARLGL